jgi:hypothetical protein
VLGPCRALFVGLPAEDAARRILEAVRESLEGAPSGDAEPRVFVAA